MQKCRTALNLGSIELFNDGSKIGEPQLPGVWAWAATTTPTQRQYPAGSMLTGTLKGEIISEWGLAPNPPGCFALLTSQMYASIRSRKPRRHRPLWSGPLVAGRVP